MKVGARAPGKVAVLGEYAVLDGAPALVLAVDRHCRAEIGAGRGAVNRLETRFPDALVTETAPGTSTGIRLVDVVRDALGGEREPWAATLDSRAFFVAGRKLGLGSSAAALCCFAAAWAAWIGAPLPSLGGLIDLHRRFQGGAGSGLDVAASMKGGAIEFRSGARSLDDVGSVQLPNGVGFAGIFAGRSASTPDLLARYHKWCAERPKEAAARHRSLRGIAEAGCAAARHGESEEFLRAVDLYGQELSALGQAIGADIVTAEHRILGNTARRFGVTYKVSGAGGGDLGLALAADADALDAFERAAAEQGFDVVHLNLDGHGLVVEERTE
ncbi:MAG TPA: hypothetical protein VF329_14005 [Gammaproteobacteria bacterium]